MTQIALILFCISVGLVLRKTNKLPSNAFQAFNTFIIYVSLPSLTLLSLHDIHLSPDLLFPVAMPWILFIVASLFFLFLGKLLQWKKATMGALILTGGLANTSFLGFPLLEAIYGPSSLPIGILVDQPGSFAVLSTLGVITASLFSEHHLSARNLIQRLVLFPPLMAFLFATVILRNIEYSPTFTELLKRLSSPLIPIALVSVGSQLTLDLSLLRECRGRLLAGLSYKLIFGPALIALLYWELGSRGRVFQISTLQAAMAPMITGAIIAAEFGLDKRIASLMVSVGIPISFMTISIWAFWLRNF